MRALKRCQLKQCGFFFGLWLLKKGHERGKHIEKRRCVQYILVWVGEEAWGVMCYKDKTAHIWGQPSEGRDSLTQYSTAIPLFTSNHTFIHQTLRMLLHPFLHYCFKPNIIFLFLFLVQYNVEWIHPKTLSVANVLYIS